VIPEFYARDAQGIPTAWVARMRESMARLTPRFCASRAVSEYAERYYLPAAAAYRQRAADQGAIGSDLIKWRQALDRGWAALRFGDVRIETEGERHRVEAQVYLDDLDPHAVRVELFADGIDGGEPERVAMQSLRQLVGTPNGYAYRAELPSTRPASDYTVRVIPQREAVAVPLEAAQILWQR
jgi:starch phosphorylase